MRDRRARAAWLAMAGVAALFVGLLLLNRRFEARLSALSSALMHQRLHADRLAALRNDSRQTFVAILERWLRAPAERPPLRKPLEARVDQVRQEAVDFATLDPLGPEEAQGREQLLNDLAAWAMSMSVSIDSDEGPEAENEIHRYFDTVDADVTRVMAAIDAYAVDAERGVAALRQKRNTVQLGFGALLVAALLLLLWFRDRMSADARVATAEQASLEREQTIKRQSQYFASLSHELRSPLVAIRGFVTAIEDDPAATPPVREAARKIQREAADLLALINNILDAAKLEASQVSLLLEPVPLQNVIDRCLARGRGLVGDKPIELVADVPADAPPVHGDFVKLQQVFTNMIANAVKFTDRGKIEVRVRADGDGEAPLVVEVADTGIGMTPEQMKLIWEPFRQGDPTIAQRYGGTGLGLSIVKALVDLHRGSITVESKAGVGTTFRLLLPRAQAKRERA